MVHITIPTLETERLIMREFRHDSDFDSYAEFYASERTRFYGGPLDRAAAWRAAAAMMGHWIIRGYGAWAVEEKPSGQFCGIVGLWFPEDWPEREITWSVVEDKQGRGIAAEASLRTKSYAMETLGWPVVHSCISSENLPSIHLAKKLGATLEREIVHPTKGLIYVYKHADLMDSTL